MNSKGSGEAVRPRLANLEWLPFGLFLDILGNMHVEKSLNESIIIIQNLKDVSCVLWNVILTWR